VFLTDRRSLAETKGDDMTDPKPATDLVVVGSQLDAEAALKLVNEMSEGNYVPRIDLLQAGSGARRSGVGNDGEFVHNGSTNLGKTFVGIFADWRAHAIMFDEDGNVIAESFDPASETFKSIKAKEAGPKIKGERPGSGADFLVWVPEHGVFGILPLLKTARRHIKPAYTLLLQKKAAVITSQLVEARGYAWMSPNISAFQGTIDAAKGPMPELTEKATRLFRSGGGTAEAEAAPKTEGDARPR
jgi:hypothetical protein